MAWDLSVDLIKATVPLEQPLGDGFQCSALALQQVEHVFNELVAVSLGRPPSSGGMPTDQAFVSYVLVLREFMHHLAFGEIRIEEAATERGA